MPLSLNMLQSQETTNSIQLQSEIEIVNPEPGHYVSRAELDTNLTVSMAELASGKMEIAIQDQENFLGDVVDLASFIDVDNTTHAGFLELSKDLIANISYQYSHSPQLIKDLLRDPDYTRQVLLEMLDAYFDEDKVDNLEEGHTTVNSPIEMTFLEEGTMRLQLGLDETISVSAALSKDDDIEIVITEENRTIESPINMSEGYDLYLTPEEFQRLMNELLPFIKSQFEASNLVRTLLKDSKYSRSTLLVLIDSFYEKEHTENSE